MTGSVAGGDDREQVITALRAKLAEARLVHALSGQHDRMGEDYTCALCRTLGVEP